MAKTDIYQAYCQERAKAGRYRRLCDSVITAQGRLLREGRRLVNFASNDYLGLSQHPALIQRSQDYAQEFGAGATASRLIVGNHPLYASLEKTVAEGKKKESALVLASGYQTNLTVLAALADQEIVGRPVTVIADRLAHHSLLQGAVLSGARLMRFRHNDYDHLGEILKTQSAKGHFSIIVSESVFGMDGDRADLEILGRLAQEHEAFFFVDEAHATGVFGEKGFGLTPDSASPIDLVMGTFGKALGGFGSYIACSAIVKDYLIQRCGGFIYSTALPPSVLGTVQAALELVPQMQAERVHLLAEAERLRCALRAQGWDCGFSTTQIIPIIVGSEQRALDLAASLLDEGFLVPAIRPPTVPPDTSRLRLSLSAVHQAEDVDRFIAVMQRLS